jgi:valyl-tRNA synthetase
MIMMGLKFMGDVPFREVYIHGLIRDAHGDKMSKSKGNVLDPIDLIDGIDLESLVAKRTRGMMQPHLEQRIAATTRKDYPNGIPGFGTDALRFTFAALASTGRDIKLDLGRVEGYRNFCNKLWNASRYVLMSTEGQDCGQAGGDIELSAADRWIRSRLQERIRAVKDAIEGYRFDLAAQAIYELTWSELCDWYLELSKPVLTSYTSSEAARRGTRRTLVQTLESLLRLAHPIMPFITEEIWQRIAPLAGAAGETIMIQPFPVADESLIDAEAVAEMDWVMQLILGVRRIKGEMNIPPGRRLPLLLQSYSSRDLERLDAGRHYLDFLARIESVTLLAEDEQAPESAIALIGEMKVLIPMSGLIDKDAELGRLGKEISKLQAELERTQTKLANPSFVDKAPPAVVQKERDKIAEQQAAIGKLEEQAEKIRAL